jgi:hypothetical protein
MKKYIIGGISLIALIITIVGVIKVSANSSFFLTAVQTSTATTSPQFLGVNAAFGTSTLVMDSYQNGNTTTVPNTQPNSGVYRAVDSATLLVQSTASTSASVQKLYFEYSQDGIDWYNDLIASSTLETITTNVSNTSLNSLTLVGNSVSSTTRFIMKVPTPTRYVRAIVNATTASSSIWMRWVPLREAIQ